MDVALLTLGDELLAGDTENTNATWLANRLTAAGATVTRILTVPDEESVIADAVARYHDAFDAVIVTGGISGTPDDVTKAGVARALDCPLVVPDEVRARLKPEAEQFAADNPEMVSRYEMDLGVGARGRATAPDRRELRRRLCHRRRLQRKRPSVEGRTEIEEFRDDRWTPSTEPASGRCPRAADERLRLSNHLTPRYFRFFPGFPTN